MMPTNVRIPLIGAGTAFGSAGAVLAMMGAGAPFLLAALATSACAGFAIYAAMPPADSHAAMPPADSADSIEPDYAAAAKAQVDAIESQIKGLRHDLRGALAPAMIMADKLTVSSDPAVRKSGEAVVKSIERASALLAVPKPNGIDGPAPPNPTGEDAG